AAVAARGRPGWRPHAVLGAVLGVAYLTRSEGVVLMPLLVVPAAWAVRCHGRAAVGRALAAGVGAFLVVVTPWTVRNLVVMDAFVLGGNNSGGAIAGSNCDAVYHGPTTGLWDLACVWAVDDR